MCISNYVQTTFFYLRQFLQKLEDDQCALITKGSIYHIKCMSIQPFAMGVDWPEIRCLMEVSIICLVFAHTVFLLCMAEWLMWYFRWIGLCDIIMRWEGRNATDEVLLFGILGGKLVATYHEANRIQQAELKRQQRKFSTATIGSVPMKFGSNNCNLVLKKTNKQNNQPTNKQNNNNNNNQ